MMTHQAAPSITTSTSSPLSTYSGPPLSVRFMDLYIIIIMQGFIIDIFYVD